MSREKTRHPGVYLLHRGGGRKSYQAAVGYVDRMGKRKLKWLTAPTLTGVLDARRTFLTNLDRGLRPDGGKVTLGTFLLSDFLPEVEATRRPATARTYRLMVQNHIVPALGDVKLKDLSRDHLRRFYRAAPTPPLARLCHAVLSSALNYAVRDRGILALNPCASVRAPKVETKEARHMDVPEARRMLALIEGEPLEGAILLGLAGGLRIGEAVAVSWGDLDLETGVLVVRGSFWGPTKSGKPRVLALPAPALTGLRRHKAAQARAMLALGIRQDERTYIVTDALGHQRHPAKLRDAFAAFCKAHGFALTFHGLRHSAAIMMLASGVDVRTVAGRLGHQDGGRLLLTTYAHFVKSADEAAAEKIAALLR